MIDDVPRYKKRPKRPKPDTAPTDRLIVKDDIWVMNVNMNYGDKGKAKAMADKLGITLTAFVRAAVLDYTRRTERKLKRMEKVDAS